MLTKYIQNDNEKIKRLFMKLLIIRKRNAQKTILLNLHKWFFNSMNNFDKSITSNKSSIINEKIENKRKNKLFKNSSSAKSSFFKNSKYKDKVRKDKIKINEALNLKLVYKKGNNKSLSLSYKNKRNKKPKNDSIASNKTIPNHIFNDSQLSSIKINSKTIENNKIKIKINKSNTSNRNKSYSKSKQNNKIVNQEFIKVKKNKTPNKNINIIKHFMNNLVNNEKIKNEKIENLKLKNEEIMNSKYTFSPKLITNKKNEKYFHSMINKLLSDNNENNNDKINNNINYKNNNNQLDIVIEEEKKNKDINFFTRLNEYEKRKINNLSKLKNDLLIKEYIDKNSENKNNKDKYNIIDDHLLSSSASYYFDKKRLIKKLIKEIDEEQGITFNPRLNKEYNNKIKNNIKNLKEELINKKNEKILDYLAIKDKECTFHPRINYTSNTIFVSNKNNNVYERLLAYQDKYNQKLNILKNNYPSFSFKPTISKKTNIILNKRRILKNLKEQIKERIIKNNKINFEEEKDSLNKNEIYSPVFHNSNKVNNNKNKINLENFNINNIQENNDVISEDYFDENNYINRDIKASLYNNKNKKLKIDNDKKLMVFDYYENLI